MAVAAIGGRAGSARLASMHRLSERKLILTYVTALTLIALLSLASHITLDTILRQSKGSAAVVNVAGRQRMLSQRIASLAAQAELGDAGARGELLVAIDKFANAHQNLLRGNQELHLPPASDDPALHAIYFEQPELLDAEVTDFIARARRIALTSPGSYKNSRDSALLFRASRTRLLADLDSVVTVHEQESERQLIFLDRVQTFMLVIVLATLLFEAVAIFQPMVRRIMRNASELDVLASTDPLTGALNRRSFFQRAGVEFERALRYKRPLTMLAIDADNFKTVNDTFGHEGGDDVLIALTASMTADLRATDLLGRIGGEEFIILLPETDLGTAEALANRLRIAVSRLSIPTQQGVATITISVGAAGSDAASLTIKSLYERADKALYTAKRRGRNQVVAEEAA